MKMPNLPSCDCKPLMAERMAQEIVGKRIWKGASDVTCATTAAQRCGTRVVDSGEGRRAAGGGAARHNHLGEEVCADAVVARGKLAVKHGALEREHEGHLRGKHADGAGCRAQRISGVPSSASLAPAPAC